MRKLLEIANLYKKELIFIYLLIIVQSVLSIMLPNLLGNMINGLILNNYTNLIIYIIAIFTMVLVLFKRYVYDTKIYTKIYNELCLNYLNKNIDKENEGVLSSRMRMSHQLVSFFENTVVYIVDIIISFSGGIYFIFTKNVYVGVLSLLFSVPTILITLYFYKKNRTITKLSNDLNEQVVERVKTKDINIIKSFLNRQRKVDILHSNIQGYNYTSINIVKYLFLSICLIVYIKFGVVDIKNKVGDIMALYLYLQTFLNCFFSIPILIREYLSIKDITKRIES